MPSDDLHLQLQKIGLEEREAKVYLANLELGPSPTQKIAQRANIPRATVYLILDDLQNKGLITTHDKGKKTLFVAEPPEVIGSILSDKINNLKLQQSALKDLIPELTSRAQFEHSKGKTTVKFYEGVESLKALIREDMNRGKEEILNIFSRDDWGKLLNQMGYEDDTMSKKRKRARLKRRIIYTAQKEEKGSVYPASEAIYVPYKELPLKADIAITGDRISFIPYDKPVRSVSIHDATIAEGMRSVFNLLWAKYGKE